MTVRTVGTGGDYSDLAAWEATLTGVLSVDQEGALFNQLFSPVNTFTFAGFTTSPTARLIVRAATAAETGGASAKHTGLAGTGARVFKNGGSATAVIQTADVNIRHWIVRDLELYSDGVAANLAVYMNNTAWDYGVCDSLLIHDFAGTNGMNMGRAAAGSTALIQNCIFYNYMGGGAAYIGLSTDAARVTALHCTAVADSVDDARVVNGFRYVNAKNCAAFHFGPTSGTLDFANMDAGSANNASSDTSGGVGLQSLIAANQFVSVGGTWDLHLKAGSALEGVGAAVGVAFDIDGQPRDASAPDIGADERVVAGSGIVGSGALTSGAVSASAAGALALVGAAAITLGPATASALATLSLRGVLAQSLQETTASGAATLTSAGGANLLATAGPFTMEAAGSLTLTGAAASSLGAVLVNAASGLRLAGQAALALDAVAGNAAAALRLAGALNAPLGAATLSGAASISGSVLRTTLGATTAAGTGVLTGSASDIRRALRAHLLGNAGVTSIAGSRVTWGLRPRGAVLPAVALLMVDAQRDYEMSQPSGLVRARVQVDCWSLTYADAVGLSGAVRRALSGLRTTIKGIQIQGAFADLERDLTDDEGDAEELLFRVSTDYQIWHTE